MNNKSNAEIKLYSNSHVNKDLIDYAVHKNMEAILGFSMKRTNNRQDAEDLTQDIIIEIYKSYTKIKSYEGHEALEGWIWAIARHTYCRWLNKRKKNNVTYIEGMISEELYDSLEDNIGNTIIKEEQLNILRREISMLSKNYRDIIVLYYLEDKTCGEISKITNIPLTAVKWRLHEAKRIIRERMEDMKTYTEKTYDTGDLWVRTLGTFNKAHSSFYVCDQIKSLLRQNILLCIYREPMEVKKISFELGVPVVYIEEEIDYLMKEGFIKEKINGKYQTDFIIVTKDIKEKIYPIIEELACKIGEQLLQTVNKLEKDIRKIGFVGYSKPWEELLWSIIPYCLINYYSKILKDIELPMKPHGNSWMLIGFEGTKDEYPCSGDCIKNTFPNINFSQTIYWTNSLTYRAGFLEEKEVDFYNDCLRGKINLNELKENKKEMASQLISKGFLKKDKGEVKLNMISFTEEQLEAFDKLICTESVQYFNDGLLDKYFQFICKELKTRVPVQLQQDIYFGASMLITELSGYTIKYLIDKKILKMPEELSASVKGMSVIYNKDN